MLKSISSVILYIALISIQCSFVYAAYEIPSSDKVITTLGEVKQNLLNPNSIKMLVWNLYKGKRQTFERDFTELVKSKDILILQEMFLDEKMLSLINKISDFYFIGATSFLDKGIRTGVLTGAHARVKESKYLKSNFNEPISKTPKMSLINYYGVRGFKTPLLVVNTHAINFVTLTEYENQIHDLYLKVKDYNGPIIMAGDFNTWSLGRVETLSGYMNKLNLKEVHFEKDERLKILSYPLDHVYYSSDIRLVKSYVHGEYDGSDHKAIEVEFLLEKP